LPEKSEIDKEPARLRFMIKIKEQRKVLLKLTNVKQRSCIAVIKKNTWVTKNRISKFKIFSNKRIKGTLRLKP
jgi:hypothetical protein